MSARSLSCLVVLLASALSIAQPSYTIAANKAASKEYRVDLRYPRFYGETGVVPFANQQLEHEAEMAMEQFVEAVNDTISGGTKIKKAYTYEWDPMVSVVKPDLVSVEFASMQDTGRETPTRSLVMLSYGMVKGKPAEITTASLFKDGVDADALLNSIVIPRLKAEGADLVKNGSLTAMDDEMKQEFVLTPSAIMFKFNPWKVAGRDGSFEVSIPYADVRSKLDEEGPLKPLLKQTNQ